MTDEDDDPGLHPLAPRDTLLGQLQRGRGIAYLRALELAAPQVHHALVECATRDPREDRQSDSRDGLYAEIAQRTGLDLAAVFAHVRRWDAEAEHRCRIGLSLIEALAKRGDAGCAAFLREYVDWGASWSGAVEALVEVSGVAACTDLGGRLCARFDDEELANELWSLESSHDLLDAWAARNPRIARVVELDRARIAERDDAATAEAQRVAQLSVEEALFQLGARRRVGGEWELTKSIERRAQVVDIELLRLSLHPHRPDRHRAAMLALSHLASPAAHDAIVAGAQRLGELRRAAIGATRLALLALPAERTLPLARAWLGRTAHPYRLVALAILAQRANEEDLAALLALLEPADADELHPDASDVLTALCRFPGRGWLPGVEHAFVELRCATCRVDAAKALAILDPERFARTYARECLWDCHEWTIRLGIGHAPLDEPLVRERLEELARGPAWFDGDTAEAARRRLATAS